MLQGHTGRVWNITKRLISVEVNKQVSNKILRKRHPAGPKPGFIFDGQTLETITHIPSLHKSTKRLRTCIAMSARDRLQSFQRKGRDNTYFRNIIGVDSKIPHFFLCKYLFRNFRDNDGDLINNGKFEDNKFVIVGQKINRSNSGVAGYLEGLISDIKYLENLMKLLSARHSKPDDYFPYIFFQAMCDIALDYSLDMLRCIRSASRLKMCET